jgi:hypothetical protein
MKHLFPITSGSEADAGTIQPMTCGKSGLIRLMNAEQWAFIGFIQSHLYYPQGGGGMDRIPMTESFEMGWRLESESGGPFNWNRMAAYTGIHTSNCKNNDNLMGWFSKGVIINKPS